MNDPELFEAELRELKPARPPEQFMTRLSEALPRRSSASSVLGGRSPLPLRWWRLSVLAPATALASLLVVLAIWPGNKPSKPMPANTPAAVVSADDVEIDSQLVSTFDAVAHLPSGEPVRLRCSEWQDDFVLRDSKRGVLIEHRIPRVEVVAVESEVY